MAFRYYKRIKPGKGLGINLSKSGVSTSYRTKRGSVNSKGFSIRTGIPGLSYRKSFKNSGCVFIIVIFALVSSLFLSCEDLAEESFTTCPETSNCGCSNKPKSQCENDPCCRWIVGEGCQCK